MTAKSLLPGHRGNLRAYGVNFGRPAIPPALLSRLTREARVKGVKAPRIVGACDDPGIAASYLGIATNGVRRVYAVSVTVASGPNRGSWTGIGVK